VAATAINHLLQVENFAPDARAVRDAVVAGPFTTENGPDGGKYTGISQYPVPHWPSQIARHLEHPIIPRLSCFRLNLAGEMPHSWVHSDDICAQWASVLYLNLPEQCSGGTAFWRHRELGIECLPSRDELERRGINPVVFYQQMDLDWRDLKKWEMVHHAKMAWNKFITYPTSFFHSRFPFEGFGSGPNDGRLIWICFYDRGGAS
jgi:hypothetical protein